MKKATSSDFSMQHYDVRDYWIYVFPLGQGLCSTDWGSQ